MATDVIINLRAEDNFSGALGNFGNIVTGIQSAVHLLGDAFRAFSGFAMEGLDAIASYERLEASLQSLVASQLLQSGAAENMADAMAQAGTEAEQLVQWNEELAIRSPFTSEGVAQAFRMAMAYGFTTDEAKRLTEAMIDFSAGTGATEASMQAIARALGQISATGKVTGGDMLQLVNAGLPVVEILAEGFGVTTEELMKMREKGLLPATEAIEYITTYLETNFAGAAERQANTWAGLQGTFADLKAMGLREFFGGLFEAIQPVAVEFASWLQGPGLELLAQWGERLGDATNKIVNLVLAVVDAGVGSLEFQNVLEDLLTGFFSPETADRISRIAQQLGILGEIIADAGINSAEFRDAFGSFFGTIDAQVISDWLTELDSVMADVIVSVDWSRVGDAFGDMIENIMSTSIDGSQSELLPAIGNAINDFLLGAMGYVSWNELGQALTDSLVAYFRYEFRVDAIQGAWQQIGADITAGLAMGISFENIRNNITTFVSNVVNYFKTMLGIASPSTVFAEIGRNIVLGLIGGFTSMISPLISIVSGIVSAVLSIFQPVLDILGFDTSGDGSLGGRTPTAPTLPGDGTPMTGGTVVNQYFAGATINVGAWDEIAYDCIYPNPFIGATGGQLGPPGGGSTSGGGR